MIEPNRYQNQFVVGNLGVGFPIPRLSKGMNGIMIVEVHWLAILNLWEPPWLMSISDQDNIEGIATVIDGLLNVKMKSRISMATMDHYQRFW